MGKFCAKSKPLQSATPVFRTRSLQLASPASAPIFQSNISPARYSLACASSGSQLHPSSVIGAPNLARVQGKSWRKVWLNGQNFGHSLAVLQFRRAPVAQMRVLVGGLQPPKGCRGERQYFKLEVAVVMERGGDIPPRQDDRASRRAHCITTLGARPPGMVRSEMLRRPPLSGP